ncbi:Leucine rich repeat containing 15 [Chamberlinius hualienensis]
MIFTRLTEMAICIFYCILIIYVGLTIAYPTVVHQNELPATTAETPQRLQLLSVNHCPTNLPAECVCHDTYARVYVICFDLTTTKLMEFKLTDAGATIWLRISDSQLPVLGPRAITPLRIEGLQINSSNISQVHQHAFVDMRHLKSLALQDNALTEIPVDALNHLPKLEMVSLAGNRIAKVPTNAFIGMPNLYYISLSQNEIECVEDGPFGITIRQIALSGNRITSLNNSVRHMPHLEWLLLTENRITTLKDQLLNLHSLTHLHVGVNNLTDLSDSFGDLFHLKVLNLSWNSISKLQESDLVNMTMLTTLDLSHNVITEVADDSLAHLKQLSIFDISNNGLVNADVFLQPVADNLKRLFMSNNLLVSFDVALPALRSLDLSHNRLESIFHSNHMFVNNIFYSRLELLILSDNQLEQLNENFCLLTPTLVYLHLDQNRFTKLDKPLGGEDGYWIRLQLLNLSSNAIETVSARAMHGLMSLMELDLSRNKIIQLELGCFNDLSMLQNLDLSQNRLEYLDLGLLDGLHDLGELKLANNLLASINSIAFKGLHKLVHLDLSGNKLLSLRYFLSPLTGLHTLNLSLNSLSELNGADLIDLKELRVLQISRNRVTAIGISQQLDLPQLSLLKLDNNQLLTLDSLVLEQLPNLLQLDLTNNFLSHIHRDTFARNSRLRRLHIQGNPWTCDNNFIDMLLGLEAHHVEIDDKNWCINSIVPVDGTNLT